ncbi:NAD kinase [Aristophania vespae]|uniref:NAD kinase n=1 Tax=Aristophania vespae TaxID=2697033 RepID=A0A6P1NG92_9PROT|nr:NAD kinase [Aristophania vespae]QHI95927.1 NAD kinase [Aristophania vespae]
MKIAFAAVPTERALNALTHFTHKYGNVGLDQAEVLVCLGGDGFLLETLLAILGRNIPVFGMNYGTVGFLMNPAREEGLIERLQLAERTIISPLHMIAKTVDGVVHEGRSFNDVYLYRQTRQTARITVEVDGKERIDTLCCDGIILSTAAGSTAYNLSARGPIIPLGSDLLSLTPVSPFHPRHWRGALLPASSIVRFKLAQVEKRPVSAVAGPQEIRNVEEVVIREELEKKATLLFDPGHSLSDRIIAEQFTG